jgi:surfeit locus 1 family protein
MQKIKVIFWVSFVVIGVSVMVGLGFWQLARLKERQALNAQVVNRMNLPPIKITGEALDPTNMEYQAATVTGVYDFTQEIVLRNRTKEEQPGVDVLTPLKIEGSDKAILVDRGWIPYEYSLPNQRVTYHAITDPQTIHGVIRLSQVRPSSISPSDPFVNADMPRLDAWYWLNISQVQQQFRTYELLPFFIEQDPLDDVTALPSPAHTIELDDGPHMSYAIQWFSFAAILAVGSIALARRTMKPKVVEGQKNG